MGTHPPVEASEGCQVCRTNGHLLRCRRCKKAWYCSVGCQKLDWKAHKKLCGRLAAGAIQATWEELHSVIANASVEDATSDYHRATDYVDQLKEKSEEVINTSPVLPVAINRKAKKVKPPEKKSSEQFCLSLNESSWKFRIEDMSNLSCYQLSLFPGENGEPIQAELLQCRIDTVNEDSSLLSVVEGYNKLVLHLLGRIEDPIVNSSRTGIISIRIPYGVGSVAYSDEYCGPLIIVDSTKGIACRSCDQTLVHGASVQHVLPMPSGRLDEMADYLICYPGQPSIDFSASIESQKGKLLFDDVSAVVDQTDLVENSTCVLAIPSHTAPPGARMEQDDLTSTLLRGDRPWQPAVDGAAVTCSMCSRILGVSPVETTQDESTVRLWRHRVNGLTSQTRCSDSSILQFCALELVRYAETRAVFCMRLLSESEGGHCLVLRALSWDTRSATVLENLPQLKSTMKVLWQRCNVSTDVGSIPWMLQSEDWCCPPDKPSKMQKNLPSEQYQHAFSMVTLVLESDEWKSAEEELNISSSYFDENVVAATLFAKLGRTQERDTTKLAALFC